MKANHLNSHLRLKNFKNSYPWSHNSHLSDMRSNVGRPLEKRPNEGHVSTFLTFFKFFGIFRCFYTIGNKHVLQLSNPFDDHSPPNKKFVDFSEILPKWNFLYCEKCQFLRGRLWEIRLWRFFWFENPKSIWLHWKMRWLGTC